MKPIVINHFSRRKEMIDMLRERGAKVGVEVGTDHGQYAEQLLKGVPNLHLVCIDPWIPYTEGKEIHNEENINQIYKEAKNRLSKYNCMIYKQTSMQALKNFKDNEVDFVFIDGNHSYSYVLEDITEWYKKVKPGGIIYGHDYKEDKVNDYGVIEAVNKFVEDNHIAPWFILHAGGRLVDCWMIIKQ